MATSTLPKIRHEEFCLPREGESEPRIERYPHYEDDLTAGRSRPAVMVTRCIECGAAHYDRTEK